MFTVWVSKKDKGLLHFTEFKTATLIKGGGHVFTIISGSWHTLGSYHTFLGKKTYYVVTVLTQSPST